MHLACMKKMFIKVMCEKKIKNVTEIYYFELHEYSFCSIKPLLARFFHGWMYLLVELQVVGKTGS